MVRVSGDTGLLESDRVTAMTSPVMMPSAMNVSACHGKGNDAHHVSFGDGTNVGGDDVSDVFAMR